ncbi:MAG: T9SS type A sorting domain-containing protein, partial [Bacteroidetes bacterium]|nr:T9SS type A sorting domain-containing protein [Bacteroidota bacterium]
THIQSDRQVLDLGALPEGIYLLRLTDQDGASQSIKFSKE